jgi:hypothetical protein
VKKRCGRRWDNTMTPRTTKILKRQSSITYQAMEEEQERHNSAAEDDGGCHERTAVEEQRVCGSRRALLDTATEEQQLPNPWRGMWQRTMAADERQDRAVKTCQWTAATVVG